MKMVVLLLKALSFMGKFKWLAGLGALLPFLGGPVGMVAGIAGTVLRAIGGFFVRLFKGAVGIVSTGANLTATITLAMLCLAIGMRLGVLIDADLVHDAKRETATWKAAHTLLMTDAERGDNANKDKFKRATEAAKRALEGVPAVIAVPTIPVAPPNSVAPPSQPKVVAAPAVVPKSSPRPKRVQPAKRKAPDSPHTDSGSGVFSGGFYKILGGPIEPEPAAKKVGKLP